MQSGNKTTERLFRALLAACGFGLAGTGASAAVGTAQVGAVIVAPVHVESQTVNAALDGLDDKASKLVVAVSTDSRSNDRGAVSLPRITYAFN